MEEFEFIGPNDKPALLGITTPEALEATKAGLSGLGYKCHVVDSHPIFETRYNQVAYQIAVIEENFAGGSILDNATLRMVQELPMAQRRNVVFFLIGQSFESLNTMQAFCRSVHCVLNFSELQMLPEVVQKTIAENDMFLRTYRDVQKRIYEKGA
jgi:hypothetical protein